MSPDPAGRPGPPPGGPGSPLSDPHRTGPVPAYTPGSTAVPPRPGRFNLLARRRAPRDMWEPARPIPLWRRLFALISLAVIALTAGAMFAATVAAALGGLALAIQSLIS